MPEKDGRIYFFKLPIFFPIARCNLNPRWTLNMSVKSTDSEQYRSGRYKCYNQGFISVCFSMYL